MPSPHSTSGIAHTPKPHSSVNWEIVSPHFFHSAHVLSWMTVHVWPSGQTSRPVATATSMFSWSCMSSNRLMPAGMSRLYSTVMYRMMPA